MAKWMKSGARGVRFYEHETRRHGVRLDRYFSIRYQVEGKRREEGLGWSSEGWTERKAAGVLAELQENQRRGTGPRTLGEKREAHSRQQAKQHAEGLTLAAFWESDYFTNLQSRLTNKASRVKEIGHYEKRIKPAMGEKPLKQITPEDVELMIDKMKAEGLAPRTQQYAVGTVFRIWKHAAKRKLVKAGDNPAAGVQVEKVNNARLRVLTPAELKSILDVLIGMDQAAHDITLFCALTGCRFSEAARLTWEFVDLTRGAALFTDTKNKESREVYLVPELFDMLERLGVGGTGEHVFTAASGLTYKEPPLAFRRAVDYLGLNKGRGERDRATFHSLRHTAATFAARRGTPVKDLQILFGWKTPAMVFRYAKGNEDVQRRAMQGLAQSLTAEPAKIIPMVKTGS
ncbi:MAG: site-specific integrase [Desulfobulbaceae bacterium]|nr:site-specific integrase [Desulfobulbaceae bacterium]